MSCAITASVVGVGLGINGALQAKKNSAQSGELMGQQNEMNQQNLAFQKMQYEHEQALTDPARQKFLADAMSDKPYGYEQEAGQINNHYSDASRTLAQTNAGTNMQDSGLADARATALQMGQVSTLAGAYRQGLDKQVGMTEKAAGMGTPQQAAGQVGGAYGTAGQGYGQQAGVYGQAAAQGWAGAASAVGGLAKMYGSRQVPAAAPGATPTGNAPAEVDDQANFNAAGGYAMGGQMGGAAYTPYPTSNQNYGASGLPLGDQTGMTGDIVPYA